MNEDAQPSLIIASSGWLPTEWDVVRLSDAANLIMGQSPPGSTYNEKGNGVPFLQGKAEFGNIHPQHIKYTTDPKKMAPKDSILMSVRAPVGDVNIAYIDYCIGRGLSSISLRNGNNQFLFYYLTFIKPSIEKEGTGSTFKAINKSKLEEIKIPLPPLPEQRRIAAVLSAVQQARERTGAVIRATKELKRSMMKHLFTYGPVTPGEADSVPLKETETGMVPEGWDVVRLGDVANLVMGQSPPGSTYNTNGKGVPFLQGKAEFGDLFPRHVKFTTDPKKMAPKGSILMSVRAPVGDVNTANIDYCIGRGLSSISLTNGDNTYLFFTLTMLKPSIEKEGTGSTFKAINKSNLEDVRIPLPPLPVQHRIAAVLSAIDAKIRAEEAGKRSLDDLFKTLLNDLMTARVRVNDLNINLEKEVAV